MKRLLTTFILSFIASIVQAQCWQIIVTGSSANHSMAIKSDGTLAGWGENVNGQVGDNTTTNRLSPTTIGSVVNWKALAVNGSHTMAIRSNGELWGWGQNTGGELGDGTASSKIIPTRIGTETDWDTISAGAGFTHAIKNDGTLWAWGFGGYNQLGIWAGVYVFTPTLVNGSSDWKSVSGGVYSAAALKTDGSLWQWGNGYYQGAPSGVPVRIGTSTDWSMMVHGAEHNLALKNDGTLWAWGNNLTGQLGDGTSGGVHIGLPKQIGTDNDWVKIAAGGAASFAIKADGTLWGWGNNAYGQLGDGTNVDKLTTQIGSASNWSSVVAGSYHTLAFKTDGTLWATGLNDKGQLGLGTVTNTNTFRQINCGFVLPVRWLSFTATKQGAAVLLKWQTELEQNADYFEVERRGPNGNFERIGTVRANGNSAYARSYSFTDALPLKTANFYRIKQIDTDGRFAYTQVRFLNFDEAKAGNLHVFPVPATTTLFISIPVTSEGMARLTIHSADGRLLLQQQVHVQGGGQLIDLDVSALPRGIYHIKATTIHKQAAATFVKQ